MVLQCPLPSATLPNQNRRLELDRLLERGDLKAVIACLDAPGKETANEGKYRVCLCRLPPVINNGTN